MRGAVEEASILINAVPIEEALDSESYTEDEKHKLRLVQEARLYSQQIAMHPDESYTTYSKLDRDVLAWVVVASKKDSFSLYTWWYPIVGSVPYKGYFSKDGALCSARGLEEDGYEVSVRPTDAISTLGWFNDPVLSTTLQNKPVDVINTVLHEIFHQTIWIPGHVPFNESAAHFYATFMTPEFLKETLLNCTDESCRNTYAEYLKSSESRVAFELEFSKAVGGLYDELSELYKNESLTREQKIEKRAEVFQEHMSDFRNRYPDLRVLKEVNNSEIIQLKIYLTELELFLQLYEKCEQSPACFMGKMQEIKVKSEEKSLDPYDILRGMTTKQGTHLP